MLSSPKLPTSKRSLKGVDGKSIKIDGLWGLLFGNGVAAQPTDTLFYSAGPGGEKHGLYGDITVVQGAP